MNKKELNYHTREEKEKINNMSMTEVIYKLTGESPKRINNNNHVLVCPIHGKTGKGYNASIKGDRVISCWSQGCLRGDGVFSFLEKYLVEVERMSDFIDRFKRIDSLLGTNLYVSLEKQKEKKKEENLFTKEFFVNKYCAEKEIEQDLMFELLSEKNSILNAGTGLGKTYFLTHFANFLTKNRMVDKVFFLTPRRSLVEEIAEKYKSLNFVSFMGNDDYLPEERNIVATTHKAHRINASIEMPVLYLNDEEEIHYITEDLNYAVIIDECHLLHTSRQIVGNIDEINRLIQNSSYTIFTSANTNHFYKACKEEYDIKNYISIKRKNRLYNLEKLEILRVEGKERDLVEVAKNILLNNPSKKTLIINNNIAQNNELAEGLREVGINAESINSKNKEYNPAYDEIIKNSFLKNEVTICTSIIDTGINIQNNNVRIIIIAPRSQFDDISIIQGFARVRTLEGNTGILITNANKKVNRMLYDFDKLKELNKEEVEKIALTFNEHMFEFYTSESYEEYKAVWNICKENDLYTKRKSVLKIDGGELNSSPLLKVDKVMLYEATRKEFLLLNHFNDDFILNCLKDVNTKEVEIRKEKISVKKEKETKEKPLSINEFITNIIKSDIALEGLIDACKKNYKVKDIIILEDIAKLDMKLAADIKKAIKTFIDYKDLEKIEIDELKLTKKVLESFISKSNSETKNELKKIKWLLYNNVYKVGKKYMKDEFKGIGDTVYSLIREMFDCSFRKNRKITDEDLNVAVEEYCKTKGYEVNSQGIGKFTDDKKFKKISSKILNRYLEDVKVSIEDIYNIKNNKIVGLKKY